ENTVMICDAEKAVAVGGIMGGLNSEVTDVTKNILLEAAYFNARNVQSSARKMGIIYEAGQRFARGADPNSVQFALDRASALLAELADGEVLAGTIDVYPSEIHSREVMLEVEPINRLLGTTLTENEMIDLLASIDIKVRKGKAIIPTFRPDITQTADLAEEVGRLFGYDKIPVSELSNLPYRNNFLVEDDFIDYLRDLLVGAGCQEIVTTSMINVDSWKKMTGGEIYPIMNPINSDMDGMRNSLIPSLLEAVRFNANRQRRDLALFEINNTFAHPGSLEERPDQELCIGIALSGMRRSGQWYAADQPVDFYDIKGLVEHLTDKILLDNSSIIAYANFAVEGQSVKVLLAEEELGYYGKVSSKLSKNFDLDYPVFVAEIRVKPLFENARRDVRYQGIPRFPHVERDFALVVKRDLHAEDIMKVIRENGGKYLQSIVPFDQYIGKQIDESKKSVAFRLIFQSPEKTLTEEEVSKATNKILKKLESAFGATLRS
ncbi:MAG: phenylalanine--tRNA ligase subunit beta, partial [Calditrichota bacterium]